MTHITCRLTAKNRDQLRNPTLCNRVWAFLPLGRIARIAQIAVWRYTSPRFTTEQIDSSNLLEDDRQREVVRGRLLTDSRFVDLT